ncbi:MULTISPECIES: YihY/virulence factor BrkB family protein [Modicisalibacter]|uniref:YihY/virulence factor BrkB family protein n=1 Tax=Modicisalibacter tunisiensis TaxID=390637 RepID=A0ABS7WZY8_9GAMM|nr:MULTISPECIES: YihY/virulence factor BrkB family protein [Modicisalibacter]MBZ9538405.1 YihY/virulence factor BrkB family protein [Modicisalibacter tunisiensis]MBZ9568183.1 YihY/virulence factor BrkB family protein [Modicisalibacter tunisiensis]
MPPLVLIPRLWHFSTRVLKAFFANRGILLAGGVGYNVLLSTIPLFALLCVLLTHVVSEQRLLGIIAIQAQHLAPTHADVILDSVRTLVDSRDVVGLVGTLVLLFFSSFAFRMLEDSIALIFHQPDNPRKRRFWVSALLPYAFMLVLGAGLLALTLLVAMGDAVNQLLVLLLDVELPAALFAKVTLNLLSFVGMFGLFSAIYKVMPVVRIAMQRALIGGFVAALLWELVRLGLGYYFANLSYVNAVYGSLATLIVVLLGLEIGAIILLLGAQVIAELERSARAGRHWYQSP